MITRSGRRLVTGVAVACALTLLAGCSIPSRPLWWPKAKHSGTDTPRDTARTKEAGPKVPTVADVWHPGMPQLGIDVYWVANTRDSDAVIRAKARRIINYAIGLGANSISLSFPFYTYGITSDTLYGSPATTPSPAHIAIFLSEAAESHIRVTLRPLLNEDVLVAQNPQAWRGSIDPADLAAWFRSYRQFLLPYAEVAATGHAATFVIGTELESLEGDPRWPALIRAIGSVYTGQLLYDENFDEFAAHDANLPVAAFGVDAYPRFQLPDSASVGELASAWEGWLGTHTPAVLSKAVLSEVGIDAVAGSYSDPGAWLGTVNSPIDQRVQRNWYEGVCRAVAAEHVAGLYWWEVNFDANPAAPAPFQSDRITFLGRSAQQVIKTCFARLSGRTS
jgi:Glycoside Hydrolase Family 113